MILIKDIQNNEVRSKRNNDTELPAKEICLFGEIKNLKFKTSSSFKEARTDKTETHMETELYSPTGEIIGFVVDPLNCIPALDFDNLRYVELPEIEMEFCGTSSGSLERDKTIHKELTRIFYSRAHLPSYQHQPAISTRLCAVYHARKSNDTWVWVPIGVGIFKNFNLQIRPGSDSLSGFDLNFTLLDLRALLHFKTFFLLSGGKDKFVDYAINTGAFSSPGSDANSLVKSVSKK